MYVHMHVRYPRVIRMRGIRADGTKVQSVRGEGASNEDGMHW